MNIKSLLLLFYLDYYQALSIHKIINKN